MKCNVIQMFYLHAAFQCPELFNITNGAVSVASRIPGSIATYMCDFGFELLGDSQRECLENETWTGEEPSCFRECFVF